MADIQRIGQGIGEAFGATGVLLFGSHARGTARADSDVDLLVLIPGERRPARREADILLHLRPLHAVDVLVSTPERLAERLALGDRFLQRVVREGSVLYGHVAGRVDSEGRS
jgi:predicted nucleotidyltransferase